MSILISSCHDDIYETSYDEEPELIEDQIDPAHEIVETLSKIAFMFGYVLLVILVWIVLSVLYFL